jgi:hypothetical protein
MAIDRRRQPLALREGAPDKSCDGVASNVEPWRLVFESARRGYVPAMSVFVSGRAIRSSNMAEWELEAMAAYRDHAYEFAQRAAAQGDWGAIQRLATELVIPASGVSAFPHDPLRGLAWARVIERNNTEDSQAQVEDLMFTLRTIHPEVDPMAVEALSAKLLEPGVEARLEPWSHRRLPGTSAQRCELPAP